MPAETPSRLAAVWFADIVGYSSLASRDEAAAVRLVELLRSLVEDVVAEHGGRFVKGTGDGALAEFGSADAAVRAAMELQRRFTDGARAIAPAAGLRVGVHVGEVVPTADGDIHGDGVNTAARLQQSAGTGEVVVSEDVWRPLRQRPEHRFTALGERGLKGLAAPIRVFRVATAGPAAAESGGASAHPARERRRVPRRVALYAAGAALVATLLVGLFARERGSDTGGEVSRPPGSGFTPDPAVETASLAVLPFDNLSTDPESGYFADGLTDELIGTLGRLEELRVAGRSSSFAMKARDANVREVGRELGVGAVLDGSVRKTGDRVRVTVELVDAENGYQLWSQTYDRESGDIFAVQEEIARAVAEALDLRIPRAMESFRVRARPPDPEAYELYLRGRHAWRSRSREGTALSIDLFRRAIALDPEFAEAHAGLADAYIVQAVYGYRPRRDALPQAKEAVDRALAIEPNLVEALATRGYFRAHEHDPTTALADFHRAIALNPSYPLAHHWLALTLVGLGRLDEAVDEHRRALELDPLSPTPYSAYAMTLLVLGNVDEAEEMVGRARALGPELWFPVAVQSRIHLARGEREEAVEAAEQAAELAPETGGALSNLGRVHATVGNRDDAEKIATDLAAGPDPCAACIAEILVALAEYDEAFRWLDVRIWDDDDQGGGYMPKIDPLYDPIRDDPRFVRFLGEAGLQ